MKKMILMSIFLMGMSYLADKKNSCDFRIIEKKKKIKRIEIVNFRRSLMESVFISTRKKGKK